MANKRTQIVNEITRLLKVNLNGESPRITNVFENVKATQVFWDDVTDYPTICVYPGSEAREYLPGNFKWAFLSINIRIYIQDEDTKERMEEIFDDIEAVIDDNNDLTVEGTKLSVDLRISSFSDDEGLLSPLGVGEIQLEARYQV